MKPEYLINYIKQVLNSKHLQGYVQRNNRQTERDSRKTPKSQNTNLSQHGQGSTEFLPITVEPKSHPCTSMVSTRTLHTQSQSRKKLLSFIGIISRCTDNKEFTSRYHKLQIVYLLTDYNLCYTPYQIIMDRRSEFI